MTSNHSPRVALVTGSASGIGRRAAEKLALDQGLRVYVLDRDHEAATAVAQGINAAGGEAKACVVDLAEGVRLRDTLPQLTEAFGPPDVLVNNAGMAGLVAAADRTLENWQLTVAPLAVVAQGARDGVPAGLTSNKPSFATTVPPPLASVYW